MVRHACAAVLLGSASSNDGRGLDQRLQGAICLNASRIGKEEIFITPLYGVYIAMMTKTAAEMANAQRASDTITVELRGAKRPQLMKMAVNHETTTTNKGMEREFCSDFRNINQ